MFSAGIHYLEKSKRIKDIGQANALKSISKENTGRRVHPPLVQASTQSTTGLWITFEQFLSVMETSLFSLKAHTATYGLADELLKGNKEDGVALFVEDPELKEHEQAKKVEEDIEREEVYRKWKATKSVEHLKKSEILSKQQLIAASNKAVLKKKSNKAVHQWKKKLAARKVSKRFRQKDAWEDVAERYVEEVEEM